MYAYRVQYDHDQYPAEGPPMHRARYAALSCKLVPEGALCVSQIRCVSDMDYPT